VGTELLATKGMVVESVAHDDYGLWRPSDCRMCTGGKDCHSRSLRHCPDPPASTPWDCHARTQ